jgi:hypothetical protein
MSSEDYAPFMKKYIEIIKDFKCNKLHIKQDKVFEYLVALELKMILWKDARDLIDKHIYLEHKNDYGTDLVDLDFTRTAQVTMVKRLGHAKAAKYIAHSVWKLCIPDMTMVLSSQAEEVSYIVKDLLPNIVVYDYDQLLNKVLVTLPDLIILPKKVNLLVPQKIDELIHQFDTKGKPIVRQKFSDGSDMYSFWISCKSSRRLNSPVYNKLMMHSTIRNLYGPITETDEEKQVKQLIKYAKNNSIDNCNQLIIWNECKLYRKFNNEIWITLATIDILRLDYESYTEIHHPDEYVLIKKINGIIKYASENDISDYEFWLDCKNNFLCDKWPYIKLLTVPTLEDEYNQLERDE